MYLDKDYLNSLLSLGYCFIASVVHDVDWSVIVKLSDVRLKKV